MTQSRPTAPGPGFVPLPPPVGRAPYRIALDVEGPLRLHSVGDVGGHTDPRPQRRVAAAMAAEPAHLLFLLGDVVYPHGEAGHYAAQFHDAYAGYPAPIYAVPGNHDAESGEGELALAPFRGVFCSDSPGGSRPPVAQPHVHFTLVTDQLWIVGLWSNVPEGGQFAPDQLDWLCGELAAAPADVPVLVAVHQPVYSADVTHGANLAFAELLDACAARAGRGPDAVFSGHAHLYERFMRGRVPYVVAGAGGYPQLHPLARGVGPLPAGFDGVAGVTLDAVVDDAHGFLTVTATDGRAEATYTAVDARGTRVADRFAFGPHSAEPAA
jgi:3',5'-cyclic AMP phosphodiesterase CpdA